jgi:hypothetical protein
MDALASFGVQAAFFVLSLGLMQVALSRRPAGGLFSALPLGLLPAAALAAGQFWAMQQPNLPEVMAERAAWTDFADKMAVEQTPDKDQAEDRAELEQGYGQILEAWPAGQFCLFMIVLAPLAAYMRRRRAKRGLAPDPGPLSRWCAPYGLVWLVLGPVFWLALSRHGLVQAPDWVDHLALNVLTLGSVIFLFQGLVVAGAKISAMARDPRTRALAILSLACLGLAFFFADQVGLLQMFSLMLVVTGLLEPWVDLRRLRVKEQGAPKGGV